MFPLVHDIVRYLTRKKSRVTFNDLSTIEPVSPIFGLDRGTPIDRYYMESFLDRHRHLVRGTVLEIGESTYARRFGGDRVDRIEVLHAWEGNPKATLVGDLTDPATLPSELADCFICTQTLNFIFDVPAAVRGMHRLLKPGGSVLVTVSGISQISRYDMDRWGDYWRFTNASLERLFQPLFPAGLQIEPCGNVLAATAFLQGVSVEDLPAAGLLDHRDPDYQVLLTVVATKSAVP